MNKYHKRFSVFISSTYKDLLEERQTVINACLKINCIPVGMEQFPAAPGNQWNTITKMIDECDFYLIIVGGRYGSIDKVAAISYTEKEYRYAKKNGLPVLVFIREDKDVTLDKIDDVNKINEFKTFLKNDNNTVKEFSTIDNLDASIVSSLACLIADDSYSNIGWVRYKDIPFILNDINNLESNNSESLLNKQKETFNNLESKVHELDKTIQDLKREVGDNKAITKEDIDKLFVVKDGTLYIG